MTDKGKPLHALVESQDFFKAKCHGLVGFPVTLYENLYYLIQG